MDSHPSFCKDTLLLALLPELIRSLEKDPDRADQLEEHHFWSQLLEIPGVNRAVRALSASEKLMLMKVLSTSISDGRDTIFSMIHSDATDTDRWITLAYFLWEWKNSNIDWVYFCDRLGPYLGAVECIVLRAKFSGARPPFPCAQWECWSIGNEEHVVSLCDLESFDTWFNETLCLIEYCRRAFPMGDDDGDFDFAEFREKYLASV